VLSAGVFEDPGQTKGRAGGENGEEEGCEEDASHEAMNDNVRRRKAQDGTREDYPPSSSPSPSFTFPLR
jgi:hypothetical protein